MARRAAPRKPAVTGPSRAAVYHRVSSEEQIEGYSLDAQQRATRAYCEAHAWDLVQEYRDEGKSAWTDDVSKRPAFARMVADAESGLVDVVVVHKLDRFSRNLMTTMETLKRLESCGVGFVSISEAMDFTSPIGKVILATLGAFAEYYSANLSAETKKGKAERKKQGLYNGVLPFGTTKGEDGLPVPHPENHAGLVLMFELAAAGKTHREVAQALTAAGYRSSGNRGTNPFSKDSVRAVLQNRFYLGELPDGQGGSMPGKHGVLVDPDLFERAQRALARYGRRPRRTPGVRSPWALSGLARCAECGAPMTAAGHQEGGRQRVQCRGRSQGNECAAPSFYGEVLDAQLGTLLRGFSASTRTREQLVRAWRSHSRRDRDVAAERAALERKLGRYQALFLEGDLDLGTYQRQKAAIAEELASLPQDDGGGEDAAERLACFLGDLSEAWTVATPAERNRLARELFDEVLIDKRTAVAVRPRPELLPFFALVELPRTDPDDDPDPDGSDGPGSSSAPVGNDGGIMTQPRDRRGSIARVHPPAGCDPVRLHPRTSPLWSVPTRRVPAASHAPIVPRPGGPTAPDGTWPHPTRLGVELRRLPRDRPQNAARGPGGWGCEPLPDRLQRCKGRFTRATGGASADWSWS